MDDWRSPRSTFGECRTSGTMPISMRYRTVWHHGILCRVKEALRQTDSTQVDSSRRRQPISRILVRRESVHSLKGLLYPPNSMTSFNVGTRSSFSPSFRSQAGLHLELV